MTNGQKETTSIKMPDSTIINSKQTLHLIHLPFRRSETAVNRQIRITMINSVTSMANVRRSNFDVWSAPK